MKKILNKILSGTPFLIITLVLFGFSVFACTKISSAGASAGEDLGAEVGKALASFEFYTSGELSEVKAEAKEDALSNPVTTVEIVDNLKESGKLEVLSASVKLNDVHKVGEDYAALYLMNANAVATVDLNEADISVQGDELVIILPKPEIEVYIDQDSIQKKAQYMRKFFNGSAEDGFDEYISTMASLQTATRDNLANYDTLLESAKSSAIEQVQFLALSVSSELTEDHVQISFQG